MFINFGLVGSHVSRVLLSEVLRIMTKVFFYLAFSFLSLLNDLFIKLPPIGLQSFKTIALDSLLCDVKYFIFPLDYLIYSLVKRFLVKFTLDVMLFIIRNQRF